jgi:hypothetical protein
MNSIHFLALGGNIEPGVYLIVSRAYECMREPHAPQYTSIVSQLERRGASFRTNHWHTMYSDHSRVRLTPVSAMAS